MSKHTPTPWKVVNKTGDKWSRPMIASMDNRLITDVIRNQDMDPEANAEFICTAVNSHADLVSSLRSISNLIADAIDTKVRTGKLPPIGNILSTIQDIADSALKEEPHE